MSDNFRTTIAERAAAQTTRLGVNFLAGGIVGGGTGDGGVVSV
jgi:hypothetical protein